MTSDRWTRIDALFDEAIALPPAARDGFLQRACADDPAMRAELAALLAAYEDSDDFMESSAMDQTARAFAEDLNASRVGQRLGRYLLLEQIGAGGMGEVYRAEDPATKQIVAIKVLPAALAKNPEALARFAREAKTVAALSHPNIVKLYEFSRDGDASFAVMELLEGYTLRARLKEGAVSWQQTIRIMADVASALAVVHAAGVVHRDIKPENIFLCADGQVRVLDFGIARINVGGAGPQVGTGASRILTAPGVVLGTAGYFSPEQARGNPVGPASDVFSLGCVGYEMLLGEPPFLRASAIETLAAVAHHELSYEELESRAPRVLLRILQACLQKDASMRPPDGQALYEMLKPLR